MIVEVRSEPMTALEAYVTVPIAFEVRSILDVTPRATGGFACIERSVEPYLKEYESPETVRDSFDISKWGMVTAHVGGLRAGGALIAFDTPEMTILDGRNDLAVLWDLRVAPGYRGRGIGTALFRAAEKWAEERGCRELKVETQNINVPACTFYAHRGCELRAARPFAYVNFPDEVQLLWYKTLNASCPSM